MTTKQCQKVNAIKTTTDWVCELKKTHVCRFIVTKDKYDNKELHEDADALNKLCKNCTLVFDPNWNLS